MDDDERDDDERDDRGGAAYAGGTRACGVRVCGVVLRRIPGKFRVHLLGFLLGFLPGFLVPRRPWRRRGSLSEARRALG